MSTRKRPSVEGMRNVATFLSQNSTETNSSQETISVDLIKLPAKQPRHYFDPDKLAKLADSIREHGILEPLLVRPLSNGEYELVAGERRLKAAQSLGLNEVPTIVKEFSDRDALQVALIENLQREDLNPVEETEAVLELLSFSLEISKTEILSLLNRANHAKTRKQTLEDNVILQLEKAELIISTIGKFTSESFRANRLPLLKLPEEVLEVLRHGKLEYTKARAISRVPDISTRKILLKEAIEKNLSLNQIKEKIAELTIRESDEGAPQSLKTQLEDAFKVLKKSNVWEDPRKKRKINKLLMDLNALIEDKNI